MYTKGHWDRDWRQARRRQALEGLAKRMYPQPMDTKYQKEQTRRIQILAFWRRHGLEATIDAFSVSRATLFRWNREPTPKRRIRETQRYRTVVPVLERELIALRASHPHLGKEKLFPLLREVSMRNGIPTLSETTIGRVISDFKKRGLLQNPKKLRLSARTGKLLEKTREPKPKLRRKGYLPENPGDLLQVDTVETFVNGIKRYTISAVDLTSRFAFSFSYSVGSSLSAKDFYQKLQYVTPFKVKRIQTDNGSEFMAHFRDYLERETVVQFFNYPRKPQYQGWIERFNRTIQEEFLDYRKETLAYDLPQFNRECMEYLIWYNTKRVHHALGIPRQRLTPLAYLFPHGQSQEGWTRTVTLAH